MIIFDGSYMLERKEDPGASPAHACTWRVKIIDFSSGDPMHPHIRPYALLAFRKEGGIFKTSCAESMGKRICRDFDLNVDDVLWVEAFPDLPGALYVAVFTPRYQDADIHYTVTWRPILKNEQAAVEPWC
ncbi:hypothetical protein [uncultured Desulfosarcina sp.]|uniref:hypothetical protein n=1 Tax=uncultured Desulfosarcina sp. TaxID=218289 RepID=UPI0029C96D35|nr:hypothetical protein [uncultured Desulfosarcina sp.]